MTAVPTPERPHENCYWVIPGRLMAGEYPGAPHPAAARRRLEAIARCGVTHFIDLTEAHSLLAPYHPLLPGLALCHERYAIRDMDIPESPQYTAQILDRMDALIAAGSVPYVHCWGGVGRTGAIVGCWLVRQGLSGDDALALIAKRWQLMAKRHRLPRSPETPQQERYVREWKAHDPALRGPR